MVFENYSFRYNKASMNFLLSGFEYKAWSSISAWAERLCVFNGTFARIGTPGESAYLEPSTRAFSAAAFCPTGGAWSSHIKSSGGSNRLRYPFSLPWWFLINTSHQVFIDTNKMRWLWPSLIKCVIILEISRVRSLLGISSSWLHWPIINKNKI